MDKYYYFADYEVLMTDRFKMGGQTTMTYLINETEEFNPEELLLPILQQAADAHGVTRSDVRIRTLNKF